MTTYWRMWGNIKTTTKQYRLDFLQDHPRALGKTLEFNGESFFDVDLLEAVRNSLSD